VKFNLFGSTKKFTLPDEGVLANELVPLADARWRSAVTSAEQRRDAITAESTALAITIDGLPRRIFAGEATERELEQAIARHRALALLLPEAERAIDAAKQALAAAELAERQRCLAKAQERRNELQAVVDELIPVLNAVKSLEGTLDQSVNQLALPGVSSVPGVEWPMSVSDEAWMRRLATMPPAAVPGHASSAA
jgi:hypothetical protein